MPFSPHSLPYKLRDLIDAKVCTPQDIARASDISLITIDRILRGAKPDVQTRHRIDQALSYYVRLRNRHLKLEPESEPAPDHSPPVRGIREVRHEFAGIRSFHVISSKGEKRLQVIAPAADVNEVLMEFMEDWLNDVDHPISLIESEPTSP
jgi:hypothetical protein